MLNCHNNIVAPEKTLNLILILIILTITFYFVPNYNIICTTDRHTVNVWCFFSFTCVHHCGLDVIIIYLFQFQSIQFNTIQFNSNWTTLKTDCTWSIINLLDDDFSSNILYLCYLPNTQSIYTYLLNTPLV